MIRVLLADDQKLVRDGWRVLLDRSSGISVVGQARDGQEAVELAQQLRPDVILMDINMPRVNGLQATRQIAEKQRNAKILMVTQSLDETLLRTALQNGAWGYLSKSDMFDELVPAVLAIQANQAYFSETIRKQYPHLMDELPPRATIGPHHWRDWEWASLDDRLERAKAQAQASRDSARIACQHSQTVRAQLHHTRTFTHELLRLRHPDVQEAP